MTLVSNLHKRAAYASVSETPIKPPVSYISYWTNMVKGVRRGFHPLAFPKKTTQAEYMQFYMIPVVLTGLLFAFLIFMALSAIFITINMCCCKQRLQRKYERKKPTGVLKEILAQFLGIMFPLIIMFLVAVHIMGSNLITTTLLQTEGYSISLLNDTFTVFEQVAPVIGELLDSISGSIVDSLDTVTSAVNLTLFYSYTDASWNSMISNLRNTELDKQRILGNSSLYEKERILSLNNSMLLVNRILILTLETNSISQSISNLKVGIPYVNGSFSGTYSVKVNVNLTNINLTNPNLANLQFSLYPNMTQIFLPLINGTNLTVTADNASLTRGENARNARLSIENSTTTIKVDIVGQLNSTKKSISGALNNFTDSIDIDQKLNELTGYINKINQVDSYRKIAQLGFICVFIIPFIVMAISAYFKRAFIMKRYF